MVGLSFSTVILALLGALPVILKLVLKWVEHREGGMDDEKTRKMGEAVAAGDTAAIRDLLSKL